jgi:hypothetical protein
MNHCNDKVYKRLTFLENRIKKEINILEPYCQQTYIQKTHNVIFHPDSLSTLFYMHYYVNFLLEKIEKRQMNIGEYKKYKKGNFYDFWQAIRSDTNCVLSNLKYLSNQIN